MALLIFEGLSPTELGVLHDALLSYMEDLGEDIDTPEGSAVKYLLFVYFDYEF